MTDTVTKKPRPLSPHLQIYKLGITGYSSILHRISGMAMMMGLIFLTWGLLSLAQGRYAYEIFTGFCASPIGQIMLMGWSAAFFYHMSTGLRHFFLDSGYLFAKKIASASGWIVIANAVILTALTWAFIYKDVIFGGTPV